MAMDHGHHLRGRLSSSTGGEIGWQPANCWVRSKGTLGSDRWTAYHVHVGRRQICWSHLLRDFQAISEYTGKAGRIGKELVKLTRKMFHYWHGVRDGTMTRARFKLKMKPLQRRVEDLLRRGVVSGVPRVGGMCWDIGGVHAEALWTFVEVEGVEPTNNRSERGLRHAVIWRKSSYGSHSEAGSRFVERMLTVRATLRAQGRNVVQFVTQAVLASLNRLPMPSLLAELGSRHTIPRPRVGCLTDLDGS